jgi:hypothetical protein
MGNFILCPIWNIPKAGCNQEQMYLKLAVSNFRPSTSSLNIPDDFSSGDAFYLMFIFILKAEQFSYVICICNLLLYIWRHGASGYRKNNLIHQMPNSG